MIRTLFVFAVASSVAVADCANAVRLKVGDVVRDCERIGYSVEYDRQVVKDLVRGEYNEKIVDEQARQLGIKDLTIKAYEDKDKIQGAEIDRVRKRSDEIEARGRTEFWIGLALGFGAAVAGAFIVKQVAK